MAPLQITQTQIVQQMKNELQALSRQLTTAEDARVLLQEAQSALRQDEVQSGFEKALDLIAGAQILQGNLNIEMMQERKKFLEESIKRAESPIATAHMVRP